MNLQNGLIAEFTEQSYTQIIFPHAKTDWINYLQEAQKTFVNIINAIRIYQTCKVICYNISEVKKYFPDETNLLFVEYETNDTWARDCSALSVVKDGKQELLNFTFNAWGNKFEATKDTAMTAFLTPNALTYDFVLEGGAVESNGNGVILTTSACMLNPNRNPHLNNTQITQRLKEYFDADTILYLNHGYLAGDDTDSHIDTLARFINKDTIMYVQCKDKKDGHYKELRLMEEELQAIAKEYNFELIALPMAEAVYEGEERLPATYANFLFVNGAVLVPTYGTDTDEKVIRIFENTFPTRDIITIECSILIYQHGSLHCVTMNVTH